MFSRRSHTQTIQWACYIAAVCKCTLRNNVNAKKIVQQVSSNLNLIYQLVIRAWTSEGYFSGGNRGFSQRVAKRICFQRDQKWWNFVSPTLKLRQKHFSTETLISKYQISKSRGSKPHLPHSDAHGHVWTKQIFLTHRFGPAHFWDVHVWRGTPRAVEVGCVLAPDLITGVVTVSDPVASCIQCNVNWEPWPAVVGAVKPVDEKCCFGCNV